LSRRFLWLIYKPLTDRSIGFHQFQTLSTGPT
jgi:hypothetical protein